MGLLDNWHIKRITKLRKLAREEGQSRCLHEWNYLGPEEVEYYNGIDTDWYTRYKLYCPKCDVEAAYNTKENAEKEVVKAKLRREARK